MKTRTAASLFAVGFLSLLGQVVLLRELAAASFGVELVYLVGLALWLLAGAAGAAFGGRSRVGPSAGAGRTFLSLAALLPLEILFLRGARRIFGGVPGAYLPLGHQLATCALAVAPAGALLGFLFRASASEAAEDGDSLAAAYAWESAGGALGSLAATLSLHWGVPNLAQGVACGACAAAVSAAAGAGRRGPALLCGILLASLAAFGALDRATASWNHPGLVEMKDTPHGRVTVTRAGSQVAVFENDALSYESEGTDAEAFVHPAALQAPASPRVLVLEGAESGIASEAVKHRPTRLDCVEGNRARFDLLMAHLPRETAAAMTAPPARVIFADPRRFLDGAETYDLILVAAPEPSSGQTNRFYTREFFRKCAGRLSARGVLALRLPSSENYWTPLLMRRNGSVHAALAAAFPDVLVLPGATDLLLASKAPLARDPAVLGGRLAAREIRARLVTADYLRYLLTNDRVEGVARLLSEAAVPPNTDGRPVCYQQTALLWLGRFLPSLETTGPPGPGPWLLPALFAGAMLLAARRRESLRRAALAAVAGFAGMAAEAVVLLRYQAESGSLYRDLGLLMTAFMIGLAAGAAVFDRAARRGRGTSRACGGGVLVALAILLGTPALAGERGAFLYRLAPASFVLAIAGALTAALFGRASVRGTGDAEAGAPTLYAADLLGGCLASVLAGLVWIPLYGTDAVCAGTGLLAVAAFLLL